MEQKRRDSELKIRISGLSDGLHEYHVVPSTAELGLTGNFSKPVEVSIAVDKSARQVYISSSIRTSGTFACDRCLDEFEAPIDTRFRILYMTGSSGGSNGDADEVRVLAPDTVFVDLTDDVRESILLSVPLKLLCREECRGLCPHCGVNRNTSTCDCRDDSTDPRWQGLQGLVRH